MNDILQNKTEVYRGAARLPGTPRAAFFATLLLIAVCVLLFNLVSVLPYGVFLKILVLIFAAVGLNRILRQGTFSVTYVLTDDNILVYITKYGLLEWESAWISVPEADFSENEIRFKGRKYDFYPEDELADRIKCIKNDG